MCGRFTLSSPIEALEQEFPGLALPDDYRPRYNVAPSQPVLAIRRDEAEPRAVWLRWGLIPYWVGDPGIGNRLINARAETLASRPAFRAAFRQRRCLVLADGFYEWMRIGRRKVPMRVRLASGRPFAMAGLWERWEADDGRPVESCAVITTDSSPGIADIHDRMPAILPAGDRERWIDPAMRSRDLAALLRPYPGEAADPLEAYAVSTLVNSPANDRPECLEPLPVA